MEIHVNAPAGIELALHSEDENWVHSIAFSDLVTAETPLKPVTWSDAEQRFKAARYGRDGRLLSSWRNLTDEENANGTGSNQYYVFGTFYARTDSSCVVSLADAMELNDGLNGAGTYVIGKPVWDASTGAHLDAGQGSEYAVRIGFRVTMISPDGAQATDASTFYIYEPNADIHLDGTEQFIDTASIDGTATLVDRSKLLQQSASTWSEANPIQRDVTVKTLGKFVESPKLFELDAGQMCRIDLYIWVEGQDVDCFGLPEDTELVANIQFKIDYSQQSGLVEIPDKDVKTYEGNN
jgi:hypothetical protein